MMEKKSKPIKLDFSTLRDYVRDGYIRFPKHAYIAEDFAVLNSFKQVANTRMVKGQPYRLDELRIVRVISGHGNITINLIENEVKEGMMMYVKDGSIVQSNYFSDDFDLEAVSVSNDLLQLLYHGRVPSCFINEPESNLFHISQSESDVLHQLISTLWMVVYQRELGKGVIYGLLNASLCFFENVYARSSTNTISMKNHDQSVFMKFINLVHQYSKKERRLLFYADKMCLSQHYLSTLIREASGSTAKEWIERSVIAEAKVMLKNTDMLTYQISDELNFPNVSFFCKYFKRITGLTPLEYQRG